MTELTALQEKMVEISEGNPGAVSILVQLQVVPELVEFLHERGPRGTNLWILFKNTCGEDYERLAQVLMARRSEFTL